MRNLKFNTRSILILFISIAVGINFLYYDKVFKRYLNVLFKLQRKYKTNLQLIDINISEFNKNLNIFKKLKYEKNRLILKELELKLTKSKIKTKENILEIIKTLTIESNIKMDELQYSGSTKNKNIKTISFLFKGFGELKNFISFLDLLENKNNILIIDSYKLSPIKDNNTLKMELKLKSVFLCIK